MFGFLFMQYLLTKIDPVLQTKKLEMPRMEERRRKVHCNFKWAEEMEVHLSLNRAASEDYTIGLEELHFSVRSGVTPQLWEGWSCRSTQGVQRTSPKSTPRELQKSHEILYGQEDVCIRPRYCG
jgi:hypothetical protein